MNIVDYVMGLLQAVTREQLLEIMAEADERVTDRVDRDILTSEFRARWEEVEAN